MRVFETCPGEVLGKPLYGRVADALVHGGSLKDCGCSPEMTWSYEDGGLREKAYPKGQSCWCTVGKLLHHMSACGWSKESCRAALFDRRHLGAAALWHVDDPDKTFEQWWQDLYPTDALHRSEKKSPKKVKKKDENFVFTFRYSVWCQLLTIIEENPGIQTNQIKQEMRPFRDGHTWKYIQEGKARGYLTAEEGKRGTAHRHYVAYWPSKPHDKGRRKIVGEPPVEPALITHDVREVDPVDVYLAALLRDSELPRHD